MDDSVNPKPTPLAAVAGVKTPAKPTLAIQMIAQFFGGKLDAFFGFAKKQQHGYRGATPSRAQRHADALAVAAMKIKPFHLRANYSGPKADSSTDQERFAVKARKARAQPDLRLPGKPNPYALEFA